MFNKTKRLICPTCLRPEKTCLCKFVQMIENQIPLVILQHSDEVTHAKNTGRLLHLCLKNSQLFVGEIFDWTLIQNQLNDADKALNKKTSIPYVDILLYPSNTDYASLKIQPPPTLDWTKPNLSEHLNNHLPRMWVIDATWRKSRKMLYLNDFLQQMPLLSLNNTEPGRYFIRKARDENQLSTFEATCYALQLLEDLIPKAHVPDVHVPNAHGLEADVIFASTAPALRYAPALNALTDFLQEQATFFKF